MIYEIYFILALFFFITSVVKIEECHLDHSVTRSRETKILLKCRASRARTNLYLSVVWPVIVARSLRTVVSHIRSLKSK